MATGQRHPMTYEKDVLEGEVFPAGEAVEGASGECGCTVGGPCRLVGHTWEQLKQGGRGRSRQARDKETPEVAHDLEGDVSDSQCRHVDMRAGRWYQFVPKESRLD